LSLSSTGLIMGTPEFPEQTQFCDLLTFADGSSNGTDAIITMTVGTGNALLDPIAIPTVSDVVSGLQNGLTAGENLAGLVEEQPACVEYYVEVADSVLGEPGFVGSPPYFCLGL
jgi:hypothetical protein